MKPNGRNIPVTEENKREYVQLYVNYRFKRGIEKQFFAIYKGFNDLVPVRLLQGFNEKELEVYFNIGFSRCFEVMKSDSLGAFHGTSSDNSSLRVN